MEDERRKIRNERDDSGGCEVMGGSIIRREASEGRAEQRHQSFLLLTLYQTLHWLPEGAMRVRVRYDRSQLSQINKPAIRELHDPSSIACLSHIRWAGCQSGTKWIDLA